MRRSHPLSDQLPGEHTGHLVCISWFPSRFKEPIWNAHHRWCRRSSVHTSPWHRVRHRNFIFIIHMYLCLPYIHINYLVIVTCIFKWKPFWYFSLIYYTDYKDSHTDFISHSSIYSLPTHTKGIIPL